MKTNNAQRLLSNNPPMPEVTESIGLRLSQARESLGLSERTVAQKLHLSVAIIKALEQDQYDLIPGAVFVRGYIKKYAHLLGMENTELPPLPATLDSPRELALTATSLNRPDQEISSNHILVQVVTWIVVLGLLALVGMWWQGQLDWEERPLKIETVLPESNQVKTLTPAPAPPVLTTVPTSASSRVKSIITGSVLLNNNKPLPTSSPANISLPVSKPLTPTVPALPSSPTDHNLPTSQPSPVTPPAPTPDTTQDNQSIAATAITPTKSVTPPPITPKVTHPQIVLEFSGNCWVDIRDTTHKYRLFGKMRKGDKRTLEGTPPYNMLLGNSTVVKLTVNEQPFDIKPHSHGGVARFQLDPITTAQ